jgi:gliding motility-associated-like protein
LYKFAVVLEDPDHRPKQQPRFTVEVLNQRNIRTPCGLYEVAAAAEIPGFKNQNLLRVRNWTAAAIDLRGYIGQVITLRFTVNDCTEGLHFGYAYLDAECLSAKIYPSYFCPGLDTSITLSAPEGFATYRWSTGQTTRSISLNKPRAGSKIFLTVTPFNSLAEDCQFTFEFEIPERFTRDLIKKDTVKFCGNNPQIVTPDDDNFSSFTWRLGKNGPIVSTEKQVNLTSSGTYYLEARDRSCVFQDSIQSLTFPEPQVTAQLEAPKCDGQATGRINLQSNNRNLSFAWSTGESSASLSQLSGGKYFVTVTETNLGCRFERGFDLPAAPSFRASAQTLAQPCGELQLGRAQINIQGGTAPYAVRWSTGDTTRAIQMDKAGRFRVSITDAQGCQRLDSVEVQKMELITAAVPSKCYGERTGLISVRAKGGSPEYQYQLGSRPVGKDSVFKDLAPGTYTLIASDQSGCRIARRIDLPAPEQFVIQLPKDTTVDLGSALVLRPGGNTRIASYRWQSSYADVCENCPEFNLPRVMGNGTISLEARNENGCPAKAELRIFVQKNYKVYIPTAFSPNGDRQNDFFEIYPGTSFSRVKSLQIFTRWGELAYSFSAESSDDAPRWDGNFRGKTLGNEVCVYKAVIEFIDGEEKMFTGSVTVLR